MGPAVREVRSGVSKCTMCERSHCHGHTGVSKCTMGPAVREVMSWSRTGVSKCTM